MSASLGLYRLQQVDSQIDRAHARLEAIRQILENDAEVTAALTRMETSQTEHNRLQQQLVNAEAQVVAQKIKIEQNESSLYSGSVKNPKELQDLQNDVVSLKKHLATLEERQLEAMINAEAGETEMGVAGTKLELVQARQGNAHGKLIGEKAEIVKQLESLLEEREAALAPIDSNLLQIYEALRKQKRGVAVSALHDNDCSSCGTTVTISLQQNARSQTQLANCPTCGRILFAN